MTNKPQENLITCPHCGTKNQPNEKACAGCSITFEIRAISSLSEATSLIHRDTEAEEVRHRAPTFQQHQAVKRTEGLQPQTAPEIPPGAPSIRIGYDNTNDLVIPLPQVSGKHAELAAVGERFVLKDLGSDQRTLH